MMRAVRTHGFTLTELAVVFFIVALLMATAMFTLSAQTDQRNFEETRRRLEAARDLVLAFAVANGRLPCSGTTSGDEAFTSPPVPPPCTSPWGGFLPARTIGFQITDTNGFGLDAWQNRIRYAVSSNTLPVVGCTLPHVTNTTNLRANGITCLPGDLVVCNRSPAAPAATTCDAGTAVTNQNTVVAIIFSTGKNGATGGTGLNEARNLDNNQLFVSRTPDPPGAVGGEFDDQMVWITAGELYSKLIAAGRLP
jgi:type II secretory pathway pseudopilin PulG